MLPLGMRIRHARPDRNRKPPIPKGHASAQHNSLLGLRVTIRFMEIPMWALLRSSIHKKRSAKSKLVNLIQLFLFGRKLRAAWRQVRKCLANGITYAAWLSWPSSVSRSSFAHPLSTCPLGETPRGPECPRAIPKQYVVPLEFLPLVVWAVKGLLASQWARCLLHVTDW